ncbi:MAG: cytochrome c [Candidatus Hydrothermarchaeales archaeon]
MGKSKPKKGSGKIKSSKGNDIKKIVKGNKNLILGVLLVGVFIGYTQLGDSLNPTQIEKGEKLYETYCVSCHGVKGIGERPDDMYAQDDYGYVAPPLDDSAHAFHHSDFQLAEVILEGSSRNQKMAGWKTVLSRDDAFAIVDYMKSLWSPFIRENCQGPKHMNPECGGHQS